MSDDYTLGIRYYSHGDTRDENERLTAQLSEANGNNHAYKSEIECWKERLDEAQARVEKLEDAINYFITHEVGDSYLEAALEGK